MSRTPPAAYSASSSTDMSAAMPAPDEVSVSATNASTAVERPFSSTPSDAGPDLVIAIDFGTTFTGVAYIHAAHYKDTDLTPHQIAQRIEVIKRWPRADQEKIPTRLAYDDAGQAVQWGSGVTGTQKTNISCFKLGLQSGLDAHYKRNFGGSTGFLTDSNWKSPNLPNKAPVDFVADYLSFITDHVINKHFPRTFGNAFLANQTIGYVVTVPACWSQKAKDLTRQATMRANIPQSSLHFITEPEAAALYCASISNEVGLRNGEYFTVCDAGGGTVDLISYKVTSEDPFKLEECSTATGGPCGAAFLDAAFIDFIRQKLGRRAESILTDKVIKDLLTLFEVGLKRNFDEETGEDEEFSLGNAGTDPDISLNNGFLLLSKTEIQGIFKPLFREILAFVKEQITSVESLGQGSRVKTVFLVGGFGSNGYLRTFLESQLGADITVIQPPQTQSAIVRGGVMHRLGLDIVRERLMHAHYGIEKAIPFEFGKSPMSFMSVGPDGVMRCTGVMHWYAHMNQKVPNGHKIVHTVYSQVTEWKYRFAAALNCSVELLSCTKMDAPVYIDDSVQKVCEIEVNLRDLPDDAFKRLTGPDGAYYSVSYELAIIFDPVIEFKLMYKGRDIGRATAKY